MNQSTERDFGNDENYKRLFAKQVYLYVLRQVDKENTWDKETCKDIAYDITMEAISALLAKEKEGQVIPNIYSYLMATVNNAMRQPKHILYTKTRKMRIIESSHHSYYMNIDQNLRNVLILESNAVVDAYKSYDIIINGYAFNTREETIAKLLNEGYNGKEIAQKLNLSEPTVSRAIAEIRLKMGGENHP